MRLKGETSTVRGENMADEGETSTKPRFASHWLTIQPSLFPEWEREMDRKACEEWERRQKESDEARKAKRVLGRREVPDMLHHEHLEHRKPARRIPSVAAPSVLPRDAAKFHGLRYADEKPLVKVVSAGVFKPRGLVREWCGRGVLQLPLVPFSFLKRV